MQVGGAFKFRGALNAILGGFDARFAGVVAFSSGNHAIAVSTAAALMDIPAIIVMPGDAPRTKVDQTCANGAEVVLYDRERDDRAAIGAEVVRERGYQLIAPFDNPFVIAGQGTVALEMVEQAGALDARLDALAIPCSGGGLAAGCALALSGVSPSARVTTVEPEGFDDMARSLEGTTVYRNTRLSGSICDALLSNAPGELTLPILRRHGADGVSVTDEAVLAAMHEAWRSLKVVLEPGGATALAAVPVRPPPRRGSHPRHRLQRRQCRRADVHARAWPASLRRSWDQTKRPPTG